MKIRKFIAKCLIQLLRLLNVSVIIKMEVTGVLKTQSKHSFIYDCTLADTKVIARNGFELDIPANQPFNINVPENEEHNIPNQHSESTEAKSNNWLRL